MSVSTFGSIFDLLLLAIKLLVGNKYEELAEFVDAIGVKTVPSLSCIVVNTVGTHRLVWSIVFFNKFSFNLYTDAPTPLTLFGTLVSWDEGWTAAGWGLIGS